MEFKITIYETESGVRPFKVWLNSFKDKAIVGRINARIGRIEFGNFGDSKSVGRSVREMRLFFGTGYRIYYGLDGSDIVVLLVGGDKSTQKMDIRLSHEYWIDYLRRSSHE